MEAFQCRHEIVMKNVRKAYIEEVQWIELKTITESHKNLLKKCTLIDFVLAKATADKKFISSTQLLQGAKKGPKA